MLALDVPPPPIGGDATAPTRVDPEQFSPSTPLG